MWIFNMLLWFDYEMYVFLITNCTSCFRIYILISFSFLLSMWSVCILHIRQEKHRWQTHPSDEVVACHQCNVQHMHLEACWCQISDHYYTQKYMLHIYLNTWYLCYCLYRCFDSVQKYNSVHGLLWCLEPLLIMQSHRCQTPAVSAVP